MPKRLLSALVLTLLPFAALAQETPSAGFDTPANQTAPAAAESPIQSQSSTSDPGQTATGSGVQGTQTAPTSGGSTADSSALQPAAGAGLGSSTTDSTGLVAPTTNPLQALGSNTDQLKVLLGSEADGEQYDLTTENTDPNQLLLDTLIIALLAAAAIGLFFMRRRQLARAQARYTHIEPNR